MFHKCFNFPSKFAGYVCSNKVKLVKMALYLKRQIDRMDDVDVVIFLLCLI